ncbi:hypothetical protein ABMA28_004998 [Loxostege sticticalis]|uniref:OAR domain-containing protein n=1 Tax=Loxostege sticticalis TaxID=481309 RepID=A0ABD0SNX4_LOXSC
MLFQTIVYLCAKFYPYPFLSFKIKSRNVHIIHLSVPLPPMRDTSRSFHCLCSPASDEFCRRAALTNKLKLALLLTGQETAFCWLLKLRAPTGLQNELPLCINILLELGHIMVWFRIKKTYHLYHLRTNCQRNRSGAGSKGCNRWRCSTQLSYTVRGQSEWRQRLSKYMEIAPRRVASLSPVSCASPYTVILLNASLLRRCRCRSFRARSLSMKRSGAFRSSPGGAASDPPPAPPPLFLPPHLSHLSQHLNHLSQPFFPLKGWGAPCPCCPKEEARSSSVAELRRKAHEHSAALLHSLASFQSRALLPLPLHLPPLPLSLLPHDAPPAPQPPDPPKHLE